MNNRIINSLLRIIVCIIDAAPLAAAAAVSNSIPWLESGNTVSVCLLSQGTRVRRSVCPANNNAPSPRLCGFTGLLLVLFEVLLIWGFYLCSCSPIRPIHPIFPRMRSLV